MQKQSSHIRLQHLHLLVLVIPLSPARRRERKPAVRVFLEAAAEGGNAQFTYAFSVLLPILYDGPREQEESLLNVCKSQVQTRLESRTFT
jgi:hypothetical protein